MVSLTVVRGVCVPLCIILVLSFASLSCGPAPKPLTREELIARAERFAGFLTGGKPSEAVKMMDSTMKAAIPESKLAELWAGLVTQLGAYRAMPRSRYAEEAGYRVVYVTLLFANAEVEVKVVFDAAGRVAGLWFGQPQLPSIGTYSPPAYAKPELFSETERFVQTGQWRLPATLTIPAGDGPFPAVVLVHGSGPHDRDETIGPNKPFKDLAWGLASQGIAVLRYEKRTKAYQGQLTDLTGFTVMDETVEDAAAAVRLLQATERVDPKKVFVLGHSLGSMLAPRIAAMLASDHAAKPAGIILWAANARDLLSLVVEQSEYLAALDGQVSEIEEQQLRELRAQVDAVRQGSLKPGEAVLGAPQAYWTDLLAYNQVETAKGLRVPMLIMQGERDYQVTMEDFGLWKQALGGRPDVSFRSYPGLNHLFIAGEGPPNPAEYAVPGNVAREVVDDIAAWVKERLT